MYDMANEPQAVKEIIYRAILESTWLHTRKFRRRPRNAYASCAAVLEAVELGEFNIVHELLKVSAIYLLSPPAPPFRFRLWSHSIYSTYSTARVFARVRMVLQDTLLSDILLPLSAWSPIAHRHHHHLHHHLQTSVPRASTLLAASTREVCHAGAEELSCAVVVDC